MRLIDADTLRNEIAKRRNAAKTLTGVDMIMLIDNQHTVERESALTCEGCKYWDKERGLSVRLCEFFDTYTKRNDWCSNARRQEK